MKYLLVLGVVVFGIWLWRHNREAQAREHQAAQRTAHSHRTRPSPKKPAHMVACGHCGLHLPQSDSVASAQGHYCSDDHRRAHEG